MWRILVTGNDTGVGKTWVTGALARHLSGEAKSVQIVKAVESGVTEAGNGDAQVAASLAGVTGIQTHTLRSFPLPIAPVAAASKAGECLTIDSLLGLLDELPTADYRIIEGAGGIAVPLQADGADWVDFALASDVDEVIIVVENRLGSINQARLCHAYATRHGLKVCVWLNSIHEVDLQVDESNQSGILASGIEIRAKTVFGSCEFEPCRLEPIER